MTSREAQPEGAAPEERAAPATERWPLLLALAAGLLFVMLAAHAAFLESPTSDEFAHLPAGATYLEYERFELYRGNPPLIKQWMAWPVVQAGAVVPEESPGETPWDYGHRFMAANGDRYLTLLGIGRLAVIPFVLLTAFGIFRWTERLFGRPAAGVSTALFLLSPTVLAHGHLATTDVGGMALVFLTVHVLVSLYPRRPVLGTVSVGLLFGAALLAKFSAVVLIPVLAVLIVVLDWPRAGRGVLAFGAVLLLAILMINVGMGGHGSFQPFSAYTFHSNLVGGFQALLPGWFPVPFPEHFVMGFDTVRSHGEAGGLGNYLLGAWSTEGWWYYNLIVLLVKTPLPFLPMVILGALYLPRAKLGWREPVALLLPITLFVIVLFFLNHANRGVRYLLPMFPFIFVLIGGCWQDLRTRYKQWVAGGVLAWYLLGVALTHPSYISYFNVVARTAGGGHRVLMDSNLDWGQDLYRVKPALDRLGVEGPVTMLYSGHADPALYGIEYVVPGRGQPVQDIVVASLHFLSGGINVTYAQDREMILVDGYYARWLRDLEPVERLDSIWIFDNR